MTEIDEYYFENSHPREFSYDEIRGMIDDAIDEAVDERLNDYYHERIVPLEREIRKLGGTTPVLESDEVQFSIRRCNPKDPFKESTLMQEYWLNPKSDYYRFFHALINSLVEHSYIKVVEPLQLSDIISYWLFVFRCTKQIDFQLN